MATRTSIKAGIAIGALAIAITCGTPAIAQDAPAESEGGDEIVVTGIRASLERAADIKREAD